MAMIVVAVPGMRMIVFLLRSDGIAVLFPRSVRMLMHRELFYALGPAIAALVRAYYAFDTS